MQAMFAQMITSLCLVPGWPLYMTDYQHVHGPLGRHKFQAELFLYGLKYARGVRGRDGRGRSGISRGWSRRGGIVG